MRVPRRVSVVVADDEACARQSAANALRELDCEVTLVADWKDLLPILRAVQPDVLLQDARMPGLDLRRLVRDIRRDPASAHIPILLFTIALDAEDMAAALGITPIPKPFQPQDLATALTRAAVGESASR